MFLLKRFHLNSATDTWTSCCKEIESSLIALGHYAIVFLGYLFKLQENTVHVMTNLLSFESRRKGNFRRIASERGDVPGWVLVVLMTAGLVTGIWTVAAPRLNQILRSSLDSMNAIR